MPFKRRREWPGSGPSPIDYDILANSIRSRTTS